MLAGSPCRQGSLHESDRPLHALFKYWAHNKAFLVEFASQFALLVIVPLVIPILSSLRSVVGYSPPLVGADSRVLLRYDAVLAAGGGLTSPDAFMGAKRALCAQIFRKNDKLSFPQQ